MMIVNDNDWSVQKRNQDSQPPRRHPPQASRPCEEREEYFKSGEFCMKRLLV